MLRASQIPARAAHSDQRERSIEKTPGAAHYGAVNWAVLAAVIASLAAVAAVATSVMVFRQMQRTTQRMLFTAGPNDESNGLFGAISAATVPEPATGLLFAVGALALAGSRRRLGTTCSAGTVPRPRTRHA